MSESTSSVGPGRPKDPAKREAIYKEIQTMWTDEVLTVPIFQGSLYLFTQKNVKGVLISPTLQFNYGPIELE